MNHNAWNLKGDPTEYVSPLTWGRKQIQFPKRSFFFSNYLESGWWTKSETPVILCVIHHRQNSIESIAFVLLCLVVSIFASSKLFIEISILRSNPIIHRWDITIFPLLIVYKSPLHRAVVCFPVKDHVFAEILFELQVTVTISPIIVPIIGALSIYLSIYLWFSTILLGLQLFPVPWSYTQ
jgi:hypothetical protein